MRINLEPGTSVGSLADKSQRYAESGVDEAFFDAFAVFTSLDQLLDFASQVISAYRPAVTTEQTTESAARERGERTVGGVPLPLWFL